MKTVIKSKTMYLSLMPAGSRPPDQLLRSLKYEATPDSEVQLAQWIMVRERSLGRLRQRQRSSRSVGLTDSVNLDESTGQLSPTGGQLMLFFQVRHVLAFIRMEKYYSSTASLFDATDRPTCSQNVSLEINMCIWLVASIKARDVDCSVWCCHSTVCLSVTHLRTTKTAKRIEVLFGPETLGAQGTFY